MSTEPRQRWFAQMMEAGLGEKIFEPADVLVHVTPQVLANHLSPELMTRLLEASLAAGAMTPQVVVETLSAETLAEHLPHEVLWACIAAGAKRSGLTESGE